MFKTAWIKFLSRFLLCKRCNSTWSYPFETRSYKITHTQLDYLKGLKQFYHLPSIPNTRLFARFTNCRNNLYPFDLSIYRCTSLQVNFIERCYRMAREHWYAVFKILWVIWNKQNKILHSVLCTLEYVSSLIGIYRQ